MPIVFSKATRDIPGLQFKKLEGEDDIYSVRIGLDYRALAVMKKDRIVWYWIGNHSEYDGLIDRRLAEVPASGALPVIIRG